LIPRSRTGAAETEKELAPQIPKHPHRIAQRSKNTQSHHAKEYLTPPGTAQFGTPNLKPARHSFQRQRLIQILLCFFTNHAL
jgi:hypothetical protein